MDFHGSSSQSATNLPSVLGSPRHMTNISFNKFPFALRYTALVHWMLLVVGSAGATLILLDDDGDESAGGDDERGERSEAIVTSMVGRDPNTTAFKARGSTIMMEM